jgi:hypothetical protein
MSNLFPAAKYSKTQCERVFKHDGRLAMQIKQENPAEYAELRKSAEMHGIVGPEPQNQWAVQQRKADLKMHPEFTSEEIAARAAFSEQDCRRLLGKGAEGGPNELVKMRAGAPNKYQVFRAAAKSYGLVGDSVVIDRTFKGTAEPADDGKFVLSHELAAKVNLPSGSRVSQTQFESVLKLIAEKNEGATK